MKALEEFKQHCEDLICKSENQVIEPNYPAGGMGQGILNLCERANYFHKKLENLMRLKEEMVQKFEEMVERDGLIKDEVFPEFREIAIASLNNYYRLA